jgi:hypothetical protein
MLQGRHHIIAAQAMLNRNREALPTKVIHYSQSPNAPGIEQAVSHKIHTPALVDIGQCRTLDPVGRSHTPTRAFTP